MTRFVQSEDRIQGVLLPESLDPMAVIREPLIVHETASIFRVLDQFKKAPVRLAIVIDEYGSLDGIVTQTDLMSLVRRQRSSSPASRARLQSR